MRHLILVLIVFGTLYASDAKLASTIYAKITKALTGNDNPKVYVHGEIEAIERYPLLHLVPTCAEADIIITTTMKTLPSECHDKIIFADSYRLLRSSPRITGAFFWSKGRPNIVFYNKRLKEHNITLGDEYQRYVEE